LIPPKTNRLKKLWSLAWNNVRLYRRRHFFTGLGLSAGFCALILLGGYMLRMEEYLAVHSIFLRQVGHLSVWKKDSLKLYFQNPEKYSFSPEEQQKIKRALAPILKAEDRVIPVLSGTGMITNGCQNLPIIFAGIDPQDSEWIYSHPQVHQQIPELVHFDQGVGYWEPEGSLMPINLSPILFSLLKKKNLFSGGTLSAGEVVNCSHPDSLIKNSADPSVQIFSAAFDGGIGITDALLVGLKSTGFTFSDETAVMLSRDVAKNLLRTDNVSRMVIMLANPENSKSFRVAVAGAIEKAGVDNFEVLHYTDESVSPIYVGAMNFVYVMMGFFVVLVCGVVILSIANSFQIAFMERRHEFATLRSVGFRSGVLRTLLMFEYIQMAAISFAVGGCLAFILKGLNNALNLRFQIPGFANDLQFKLEPTFIFTYSVALAMMIIVVVSVHFFARQQMKLKVIELMGTEA
jgi:putative ABC transport system permease protein